MPSLNQVVSAVAFAGLAAAAPAPAVVGKQTFSVPRQVVHEGTLPYGPHEVLKTFRKFKAEAPSHVVAAAAAATGRVTASPSDQFDSSYLCPVSVGGKTLNLDFDTGSSDLWVFSNKQPTAQTTGHNLYTVSSSKQLNGYSWDISYGDGSGAAGLVYRDTVTIGGVTYSKQAVEAATSVSSEFTQDTGTDGLVGLAFDSINTVEPTPQKTFFTNVLSSLAKPIIAANLKYHTAGEYDFGFIDTSKFTGSLAYTNVDSSQGFWGITVSGFGTSSSTTKTSFSAIADTGTTLVYVPTNVVSSYYKKVKGAQNSQSEGGYVFPCSATLPDFYLKIGSYTAKIPGKFINYAPTDNTGTTCFGGIQDSNGIGISILGDVFLKSQYVVFDRSVPRLGLAQQVGT